MSLIQKIMPARSEAQEKKYRLIADLDEFHAETYVVKILNQTYELEPITGKKLKEMDDAYNEVKKVSQRIGLGENIALDQMLQAYYDFCKLVIPELKLESLFDMTTKQVNELLRICFRFATNQEVGNPSLEEPENEKKKSLT